jgi:hypothetical protein
LAPTVIGDAESFDEAVCAGLETLCWQRPNVLAHAVRAVEPRSPLRPLGVLCGEEALAFATLGSALFRLRPPGTGLTRAAVREGGPVWVGSIAQSPSLHRQDLLARYGVRSGAAFPVAVGAKLATVIELLCFDELDPTAMAAGVAVVAELQAAAAYFWGL